MSAENLPRKTAIWERAPEQIDDYGRKLCRLPGCITILYAKNLCATHYHMARSGRLDPETGELSLEAGQTKDIKVLPNMGPLDNWVYIGQIREFLKKQSLRRMSLQAAVDMDGQIVKTLVRTKKFEVYQWMKFLVYNPYELEQQFDEFGDPARPPVEEGCYNTFIPSQMMWAKAPCSTLPPHLDALMTNLSGPDRQYFDRWLAYMMRNPGQLGCALILRGIHGSGKSLFLSLLETVFKHYATKIRTADLENAHNSWLEEKLFVFADEMTAGSAANQRQMMNTMKQYIAGGNVLVNRKHVAQYSTDVWARWIICSNSRLPIIMEDTERRYSVLESVAPLPRWMGHEISLRKEQYAQALLDYLITVDISNTDSWEVLENEALKQIKVVSASYLGGN